MNKKKLKIYKLMNLQPENLNDTVGIPNNGYPIPPNTERSLRPWSYPMKIFRIKPRNCAKQ